MLHISSPKSTTMSLPKCLPVAKAKILNACNVDIYLNCHTVLPMVSQMW